MKKQIKDLAEMAVNGSCLVVAVVIIFTVAIGAGMLAIKGLGAWLGFLGM